MKHRILYAQSGGVTPVINATAAGVIQAGRDRPQAVEAVFAAQNGILGVLHEQLVDTGVLSESEISQLAGTPGGAFGSCRYKLASPQRDARAYERVIHVLKTHGITALLYNGGGDSQDTACKIEQYAKLAGYPLQVLGLPKTIDNDLFGTDHCPGFGCVAKYAAVSIREAALDLQAMSRSSTQVFILEVMGRHTGWITAGAGLARVGGHAAPQLLVFPERPLRMDDFLVHVEDTIRQDGYVAIVVSEGARDQHGQHLAAATRVDAFGHAQLGGAGPALAQCIEKHLGLKTHVGIADYLQRAARHIGSATDATESFGIGQAAVEAVCDGLTGHMMTIERISDEPYCTKWGKVPLDTVANREKTLPDTFIDASGYHITEAARRYLQPLIAGEMYPTYSNGLPQYWKRALPLLPLQCPPFSLS